MSSLRARPSVCVNTDLKAFAYVYVSDGIARGDCKDSEVFECREAFEGRDNLKDRDGLQVGDRVKGRNGLGSEDHVENREHSENLNGDAAGVLFEFREEVRLVSLVNPDRV